MKSIQSETLLKAIMLLLVVVSSLPSKMLSEPIQEPWRGLSSIKMENVMKHVEFFSSFESRMTGYPGFYKASEYIAKEFNKTLGN
ncbi:hypothetical protein KEJ48_07260, partial [Candidatus Bathyarchaeota archaeon]|nr:hypothetical protein [Candidatus Bathyarchaeota archaeon]